MQIYILYAIHWQGPLRYSMNLKNTGTLAQRLVGRLPVAVATVVT